MICNVNPEKLRKFNKKETIELEQLNQQRVIITKQWEAAGLIHRYNKKIKMKFYVVVGGNNS